MDEEDHDSETPVIPCLGVTWGKILPNYQRSCLCLKCVQWRMWERQKEEDCDSGS